MQVTLYLFKMPNFDFAPNVHSGYRTGKTICKKFLYYDIEKIVCYHGGVSEGEIKAALKNCY